MKKTLIGVAFIFAIVITLVAADRLCIGKSLDSLHGINVYYNGFSTGQSHGKHFAKDGYYFGRKWQCVEFVKRYYYMHLGYTFPDGWGHAKDFFDAKLSSGSVNKRRGLLQFSNGDKELPKVNDLLVYNHGKYGHVAIVALVGDNYVEIVQQNVFFTARKKLSLHGTFIDAGKHAPIGWLRLKQ